MVALLGATPSAVVRGERVTAGFCPTQGNFSGGFIMRLVRACAAAAVLTVSLGLGACSGNSDQPGGSANTSAPGSAASSASPSGSGKGQPSGTSTESAS